MTDSGKKTITILDDMTLAKLRSALSGMKLSTRGSAAVLRNRLRKAQSKDEGKKINDDDEHANGNEDTDDEEDNTNVDLLSRDALEKRLRRLGLRTTGDKATLRVRLKDALRSDDENKDDDDSSDDNSNDNEERAPSPRSHQQRALKGKVGRHRTDTETLMRRDDRQQPVLTFKDVEESLETFNGDGNQSVRRWLNNFEETARMYTWSDIQKLIYAKRLLCGSAKLYVSFENAAAKWSKLKKAFIDEFSKTMNSKQVHNKLSTTRKKYDESCQEYMYKMLELATPK